MKRLLPKIIALALLVPIGALIFAWSGLYNVAATKGHFAITAWFLHFAMRNSVETHAIGIDAPPLQHLALVERGAGHYETGCAPCHGSPNEPGEIILQTMVPPPPDLRTQIDEWTTEELFWIVKHGIKYAGMPAWPAQTRDDEVWAMTAFLLRLPDLSREDYASLAKGEIVRAPNSPGGEPPLPETPGELFTMSDATLIGACIRCHGIDGAGRPSGAFPRLGIQSPDYLARALSEYQSGIRPSGIMQPVAAALDEDQIARLARHYGEAAPPLPSAAPRPEHHLLGLGRTIATEGIPENGVAACATCHGMEAGPVNPEFPSLTGQYAAFTAMQLQLWKAGLRGGGAYSEIMETIAAEMTETEIEAVALFYEGLPRVAAATEAKPGSAGSEPATD